MGLMKEGYEKATRRSVGVNGQFLILISVDTGHDY